jgi:predicted transcriptional regulator
MPRPKAVKPTPAELEVLHILWNRGASTVRDVYKILMKHKGDIAYTTVLKTLQNMAEKGLVNRDESQRSHVYEARTERDYEQQRTIHEVKKKLFYGSVRDLVLTALSSERPSKQELEEIKKKIDELEKR